MRRSDILSTANRYVSHDRQADHGAPEDTFGLIARLWNAYLDGDGSPREHGNIDSSDVAMMLALLKVARQRANPAHADNYIDLAGYAACAGELAQGERPADTSDNDSGTGPHKEG